MPASDPTEEVINIRDLQFSWLNSQAPILDIVGLRVGRGERVFIEGPSGCGKSTLLSLMAGVVTPQQGTVSVLSQHIETLNSASRDRFRADHIGFIFQMFNLIPYLSVVENVTLPCRFSKKRRENARRFSANLESEALRLLNHLDMADPDLIKLSANELSAGQQQRVAAARALIGAPEILIADEPTSSLDSDNREAFIRLLLEECEKEDTTLIFVSHDTSLRIFFNRTIRITDINRAGISKPQSIRE